MTTIDDRPAPTQPRTIHDIPAPRQGWARDAACRTIDAEIFLDAKRRATATWICGRCPVTDDCLREALRADDDAAVAGGLSRKERRQWLTDHGYHRPAAGSIDVTAVANALDAGLNYDQIGQAWGVSGNTLQQRMLRAVGRTKPAPDAETAARDAHVVRLKETDRRTWRSIATEHGVSPATAMHWYRRGKSAQQVEGAR